MRLHHVALVGRSLENADQFYEEIVGLKKIKTVALNKGLAKQLFDTALECQIVLYGNENFSVEVFITATTPRKISPFVHLCLEVDNRKQFLENCQSAGIMVNRVPRGDSSLIFVEDFDGNLFEVKESPEDPDVA